MRSSSDPFIDAEVLRKTREKLFQGWLKGPILASDLPEGAVLNRRFGIKQTSGEQVKVRLIDDFSQSWSKLYCAGK